VAEVKVPAAADSGDDVDSGNSSDDSSDGEEEAAARADGAEEDRTEDPETNDESFTSGYVEDPVQARESGQGEEVPVVIRPPSSTDDTAAAQLIHSHDQTITNTHITANTAEPVHHRDDGDSKNPFGESDDEEEIGKEEEEGPPEQGRQDPLPPRPELKIEVTSSSVVERKPRESLNPFGSDTDSDTEGQKTATLTATSQQLPHQQNSLLEQGKQGGSKIHLNPFGSDLSSDEEGSRGSVSPSPSTRSGTRLRKKRRAPLPPRSLSGTPKSATVVAAAAAESRPVPAPRPSLAPNSTAVRHSAPPSTASAELAKRLKDENNMNRRSQIMESIRGGEQQTTAARSDTSLSSQLQAGDSAVSSSQSETVSLMSVSTTTTQSADPQLFSPLAADKADEGQWRKKKGPAPPRPIPPRRAVRKLHRKVINQELEDIEVKQGELERQGVRLEKTIREICEKSDAEEGADRDSLGPEAEDLIIQLFDLVNEKNELFRRQTELIYMKKENRLEEQHADLEHQIRVLMARPESQRTAEDRGREERLIARLVTVVGLRNEIVDCLEMDRLR